MTRSSAQDSCAPYRLAHGLYTNVKARPRLQKNRTGKQHLFPSRRRKQSPGQSGHRAWHRRRWRPPCTLARWSAGGAGHKCSSQVWVCGCCRGIKRAREHRETNLALLEVPEELDARGGVPSSVVTIAGPHHLDRRAKALVSPCQRLFPRDVISVKNWARDSVLSAYRKQRQNLHTKKLKGVVRHAWEVGYEPVEQGKLFIRSREQTTLVQ